MISDENTNLTESVSSDAMITITSKITSDDDSTSMTFSAPCRISTLKDKVYIFYNEYLTDGGGPTKCRLSIEADRLMLKKDGEVHTLMIFDPAQNTSCRYKTAFGCNNFTLHTESIALSGGLRPGFTDDSEHAKAIIENDCAGAVGDTGLTKAVSDTGHAGACTLAYEMWNGEICMGSYLLSIRIN